MKASLADAAVWAVFSVVGIAARSFLPSPHGVPPGGFANRDNILACVAGGVAWILLRAASRAAMSKLNIPVLRIIITLTCVPLAYVPIFLLALDTASRLILLFPFVLAGTLWGSITAAKNARHAAAGYASQARQS